jgi:hypothetical protein
MPRDRLSRDLNHEARFRLYISTLGGTIATFGIYFVGIYISVSPLKIAWMRPFCSALAIVSGISVLNQRVVLRSQEYIQQGDRDALIQARQERMYQPTSMPRVPMILQREENDDVYLGPPY